VTTIDARGTAEMLYKAARTRTPGSRGRRRLDDLSATVILQAYLDALEPDS